MPFLPTRYKKCEAYGNFRSETSQSASTDNARGTYEDIYSETNFTDRKLQTGVLNNTMVDMASLKYVDPFPFHSGDGTAGSGGQDGPVNVCKGRTSCRQFRLVVDHIHEDTYIH